MKLFRKIEYQRIVKELKSTGHPTDKILTFEQWESMKNHVCSFVNKLKPTDDRFYGMIKCDNDLCNTVTSSGDGEAGINTSN